MNDLKVLKNPAYVCDLNYVFFMNFNSQVCLDAFKDERKKAEYGKYIKETLKYFGEIPDDLYVFYHAAPNGRCFITTHYFDTCKDVFTTEFDFKYFKSQFNDCGKVTENLIRFYFAELPEDELLECIASRDVLYSHIKKSNYDGEEKSKLYEFFIDPVSHIHTLQRELIEKEILLSNYYKENYEKILKAANETTFEVLCENVKQLDEIKFLMDSNQQFKVSFCLINKNLMYLFFLPEGAIYLLGVDYTDIISDIVENKSTDLGKMCTALSENSRLQILDFLKANDEVTCKDLEKEFNFSGSTAYHHVTLLMRSGLVSMRNIGKTIYYSINRKKFANMIDILKTYTTK